MRVFASILLSSLAIATVSTAGIRLSNIDIEKSIENLPSHHEKYKKHFMKKDATTTVGSTTAGWATTAGSTTAGWATTAGSTAAGSTTAGSTAAGSTTAGWATTAGSTTAAVSTTAGWVTTAAPTTFAPTTTAPTTAPRPPCPDDWIEHWNHDLNTFTCFKFLGAASHEQKAETWFQAQQACEGLVVEGFEGTPFLAEPYLDSINEFLIDLAEFESEFTKVNTWYLGLSDLGHEGNWKWMNEEIPVTDSQWLPGSPDTSASNNRDCGIMLMSGASHEGFVFGWTDVECDKHIGEAVPICQLYPLV